MKFNNGAIILISLILVFLALYAALLACTLDKVERGGNGGNIPVVLEPIQVNIVGK